MSIANYNKILKSFKKPKKKCSVARETAATVRKTYPFQAL